MRVALVHDHLTQNGGAERVLYAMMQTFPDAPVYTLVYNRDGMDQKFIRSDIRTSYLQHLPLSRNHPQFYLPLMPGATERHKLRDFDVVISSASAFAKGVITSSDGPHICYCHTPTRYLWGDGYRYIDELPYPWVLRRSAKLFLPKLKSWDKQAAARPTVMVANSIAVQKRIRDCYGRDAEVLYPPVDSTPFSISPIQPSYFLTGGRLVAYKRFDIVVQAFNRLRLPLKIFGVGPDRKRLESLAKSNISFLGFVADRNMPKLFSEAVAFVHPQEEDFGITAVESMAAGRPVIAYAAGGALETVEEGTTGTFFDEQSWEALGDTIIRFRAATFDPKKIRTRAQRFSPEIFSAGLRKIVHQSMNNYAYRG